VGVQIATLTGRSLRSAGRDRTLLLFGLLQPVLLLVLFSQVFTAVGTIPALAGYGGYTNFLVPATLVNVALTTAMSSGAGLVSEARNGMMARFRIMPMRLVSVLVARGIADGVRLAVQLVVVVLTAVLLLGFRPAGGVGGVALAGLVVLAVGWALGWVFIALATWARRAETLQAVSLFALLPLMFSSSAYVPLAVMPTWIRVLSSGNPLTYAIESVRGLALDRPAAAATAGALGAAVVAAALGAAVATRNVRRFDRLT
jgi:ABC-2 type transport system permease protein